MRPSDRLTASIRVMLTRKDKRAVDRQARRQGLTTCQYVRGLLGAQSAPDLRLPDGSAVGDVAGIGPGPTLVIPEPRKVRGDDD